MILTCCPACQTLFRVTPEQLKVRAGKVRCGQCKHIFNALDHLREDLTPASTGLGGTEQVVKEADYPADASVDSLARKEEKVSWNGSPFSSEHAVPISSDEARTSTAMGPTTGLVADNQIGLADIPSAADAQEVALSVNGPLPHEADLPPSPGKPAILDFSIDFSAQEFASTAREQAQNPAPPPPLAALSINLTESLPDDRQEPTLGGSLSEEVLGDAAAARVAAGGGADVVAGQGSESPSGRSVAASVGGSDTLPGDALLPRDTREIPGYNKWAEGTLAAPDGSGFEASSAPARWPFVLVILLLLVLGVGQGGYYYRTDLAIQFPLLKPLLEKINGPLPLPRKTQWVSIESSDLQADTARGLLILNANLRNRAAFSQALPSLELTLIDAKENELARKVLAPEDYLPEKALSRPENRVFAAGVDIPVKVWINAGELPAAGYLLYVFYP